MSDKPDDTDVARLTAEIRRAGFAVSNVGSLQDFLGVCAAIGKVLSVQDVKLVLGSPRHVCNPAPVPLHCDGPDADIIGWYCVRQDERDGASLLLDTAPVVRSLAPEIRAALASVRLPYFDSMRASQPKSHEPILRGSDENGWQVNYAPWLLPAPSDDVQRRAIAAFQAAVSNSDAVQVRLAPGQCLAVDNWRMLHGRSALTSTSARLLKRAWVRTVREPHVARDFRPPGARLGE